MLTEEQRAIVESKEQHILVVANAGTGKTFTVINKLDYLVNKQNILPERILLTSFSRVASSELYEKASAKIGLYNADKMTIGTLHSICYKIVLENLEKVNLKSSFNIVNEAYIVSIAYNKYTHLFKDRKSVVKKVSLYRKNLLMGKKDKPNSFSLEEFQAIRQSQEIMEADNKIIFDDLLIKTVELFKKYPDIQRKWMGSFDILICDEVQDTSKIQWEIIDLLRTFETKTLMVGDAKQNIYAFRGCSFLYMDEYRKINNAKVYNLSETFRFGENFAEVSNKIIRNMEIDNIYKKETITNVSCSNEPVFHDLIGNSQIEYIIKDIEKKQVEGFSYKDFNLVYRYNKEALPFMKEFIKNNIPFEVKSGDIFERIELKFILKSFSVIMNFTISDCIDLFKMYPNFVGDKTLTDLYNKCEQKDSIFSLLDFSINNKLEGIGTKKSQSLVDMKRRLTILNKYLHSKIEGKFDFLTIANIMNMEETKFMLKEEEDDELPSEDRYEFLGFFQENFNKSEFNSMTEWFTEVSLNGHKVKEKENNKVKFKTVHGCKGQSLPIVYFIANRICDPIFINTKESVDNEKFVLYVAMTRAEKHLEIFIDSPDSFNFNFIYNKEWTKKYVSIDGKPLVDTTNLRVEANEVTGVYNIPNNVLEELKNTFKSKKNTYKTVLTLNVYPVRSTAKAIMFEKNSKEQFWIPFSALGFHDKRYFIESWVVKANKLDDYVEKY